MQTCGCTSHGRGLPGTTTLPTVSIEVLVEQDQVLPVWVVGIAGVVTMARPLTILVSHKNTTDTTANLLADLQQGHHLARASGALHLEFIPIVEMVTFQSFRDQEVD